MLSPSSKNVIWYKRRPLVSTKNRSFRNTIRSFKLTDATKNIPNKIQNITIPDILMF